MKFDAALTQDADSIAREHLLQHFLRGERQEDLCFAIWRPSTGRNRLTALIDQIILPMEGERTLHGNASFLPDYMARAIAHARREGAGLAFMHSHPGAGWQDMSNPDTRAERDVLAYPAGATGLPLVGLTAGVDGTWSARFWQKDNSRMDRHWCGKTRVVGSQSYRLHFNDDLIPPPPRRNILRRSFDTWGPALQNDIARLNVGIVGLGSVGCLIAEAVARMGIGHVTLIDPDNVEEHNLDRLLHALPEDIGKPKVEVAASAIASHATADPFDVVPLSMSVHEKPAFEAALDCDVLFSCVDRPVARDVLNFIAQAHLIPVIDGGVSVEVDHRSDTFFSAHWRAHIVTPHHQCLRCNEQYDASMVMAELDGSLDDPTYIRNLPPEAAIGNQNVFPFSQSVAAMQVNLLLHYLAAPAWWPTIQRQEHQFVTGETHISQAECGLNCSFRGRRALGDSEIPFYLREPKTEAPVRARRDLWDRLLTSLGMRHRNR